MICEAYACIHNRQGQCQDPDSIFWVSPFIPLRDSIYACKNYQEEEIKMELKMSEVQGDELPYRIELDSIKASGITMSDALMRALHLKGILELGEYGSDILKWPKREAKKEAATILFWHFEGDEVWTDAIRILEEEANVPA